jgi:hypothetical protein
MLAKYQEFNKPKKIKNGQLRVWHIPQVPSSIQFFVYVKTIQEAKLIVNTLAYYDLYQFEHKIKPDYSNASGLEVYEKGEWIPWEDEYGSNIDCTELLEENKIR